MAMTKPSTSESLRFLTLIFCKILLINGKRFAIVLTLVVIFNKYSSLIG